MQTLSSGGSGVWLVGSHPAKPEVHRASGVVRIRLSYERPDGTVGEWQGRARIRDGEWRLREELPPEARHGGYLTIQYTGYLPGRVRGEQIAKQVLAGQVFDSKLG